MKKITAVALIIAFAFLFAGCSGAAPVASTPVQKQTAKQDAEFEAFMEEGRLLLAPYLLNKADAEEYAYCHAKDGKHSSNAVIAAGCDKVEYKFEKAFNATHPKDAH